MNVSSQLRQLVAATLKVDPKDVDDEAGAATLPAWDSMAHVNLMVAIEQTFDIELEPEEFTTLVSVPAIRAHLASLGIE